MFLEREGGENSQKRIMGKEEEGKSNKENFCGGAKRKSVVHPSLRGEGECCSGTAGTKAHTR